MLRLTVLCPCFQAISEQPIYRRRVSERSIALGLTKIRERRHYSRRGERRTNFIAGRRASNGAPRYLSDRNSVPYSFCTRETRGFTMFLNNPSIAGHGKEECSPERERDATWRAGRFRDCSSKVSSALSHLAKREIRRRLAATDHGKCPQLPR